ncbi:MAG: hypothetical protein ABIJ56_21495 [Pseudomonadota bacterium]
MKKAKTIIFFIIVVAGLRGLGCGGVSANVPKDFELEYLWGAGYQDGGASILKVEANGKANLLIVDDDGSRMETKFSLFSDELEKIYKALRENRFFKLKKQYRDYEVLDGGYSTITVTAGGRKHKVLVSNTSVEAYGSITKVIFEVLRERGIID